MTQASDDAASELGRQQEAQSFVLPDAPLWDDVGESPVFQPDPEFALKPSRDRDRDASRDKNRSSSSVVSLEDLYDSFPEIGKGDWKLRITRFEPKSFRGHSTAGFLCELYDRISLEEFRSRFGGGVYQVLVMKPTTQNEGTLSDYKTAKDVRFRVSGDPNIGGDSASTISIPDGSGNVNTQVETQRMQLDARERDRLHLDRQRAEEKADRIQRDLVPNFYETTKRMVDDVQGLKTAQIEFWRDEADRIRQELIAVKNGAQSEVSQKDAEIRRLQEEIIELKQKATATTLAVETKVVSDMRVSYDARIAELKDQSASQLREVRDRADEERRRIMDENSKKLDDISKDHRRIVEDMTRRNDEERRNYESAQTLERERLREDSRYRIDQITAQKQAEVTQLRETFDQRIADLRLSTDRELQSVRDMTAREIESIRQSERAKSTLARESAEMKREAVKAEEQRIRSEVADLRRENSDLRDRLDQERAKQHKDPMTAIREIREMGAELGLVDASIASEKPEGESNSTMAQFLGLARQAFDSAPQVLEKIMQARKDQADSMLQAQQMQMAQQQQMQMAQQQQMQQGQAQAREIQQRQVRQLAAPQTQAPQAQQAVSRQARYAPPAAPVSQSANSAPPSREAMSSPFGSAYSPPTSPVPFAPTPSVMASPLQAQVASESTMQASGSVESQLAVVGSPSMASPSNTTSSQVPSEKTAGDTGALIIEFFQKLEGAVANKVLSPETFAIGVISEIGPEQTAMLLGQFKPQDIVETAQQLSANTAIATRDGQRFVANLWKIATAKVQEQGYSP